MKLSLQVAIRLTVVLLLVGSNGIADDSLVLHDTFDQSDGPIVRDRSGHSHDGAIHGGVAGHRSYGKHEVAVPEIILT